MPRFPPPGPATAALLAWLQSFGLLVLAGVEGTGAYGAGLTTYLSEQGITVVEIDRPNRKTRRRAGKSDPIDAEAAARAPWAKYAPEPPNPATARSRRCGTCESPAPAPSTNVPAACARSKP